MATGASSEVKRGNGSRHPRLGGVLGVRCLILGPNLAPSAPFVSLSVALQGWLLAKRRVLLKDRDPDPQVVLLHPFSVCPHLSLLLSDRVGEASFPSPVLPPPTTHN